MVDMKERLKKVVVCVLISLSFSASSEQVFE